MASTWYLSNKINTTFLPSTLLSVNQQHFTNMSRSAGTDTVKETNKQNAMTIIGHDN